MEELSNIILYRRAEVFRKLREREPELMTELDILESAARGSSQKENPGPYSDFQVAIEAITSYLKKVGKPVAAMTIAEDLVAGGYGYGKSRARPNVIDSIRYHCRRNTNSPIEEIGELEGEKMIRLRR